MTATAQIGILVPGTLPEGWCAQSEQDRYQTYFKLAQVRAFTAATASQYFNFGNSTPTPDNRIYPWLRTEADGAPDRWYVYYDGIWCWPHSIPSNDSRVIIWTGSAGDIDTLDGGTAGTATTKSGPFWQIDTTFAQRMPVGVGTLPLAGTALAVGDTGGADQVTLTAEQLPAHKHPVYPDGRENEWAHYSYDSGSTDGTNQEPAWPITSGSADQTSELFAQNQTGTTGSAHNNMPPYRTVYFIKRTARQFYTQTG